MKFVDVTNDIAFRKIFRNENKKIALISFLNAVIVLPNSRKIIDVTITNPYQLPKLHEGKSTIVDVKAKDDSDNIFIVEMQVADVHYFQKRILYYTSQSYVSQIDKGDQYHKLNPAYFIGILDFKISQNPNYLSCHQVLDVETGERIIRDVEFNFIELPKFNKTIDDLQSNTDKWVYFIKNAENLAVIPEGIDDGLREAYTEADKHSWTKSELEEYEKINIRLRDEIGRLEQAEIKGEQKGKMEEKYAIARKLKAKGMDIDFIMETTGLSKSEIEKI